MTQRCGPRPRGPSRRVGSLHGRAGACHGCLGPVLGGGHPLRGHGGPPSGVLGAGFHAPGQAGKSLDPLRQRRCCLDHDLVLVGLALLSELSRAVPYLRLVVAALGLPVPALGRAIAPLGLPVPALGRAIAPLGLPVSGAPPPGAAPSASRAPRSVALGGLVVELRCGLIPGGRFPVTLGGLAAPPPARPEQLSWAPTSWRRGQATGAQGLPQVAPRATRNSLCQCFHTLTGNRPMEGSAVDSRRADDDVHDAARQHSGVS
jgi:hypothetical protein